jgi:hypothetical protein
MKTIMHRLNLKARTEELLVRNVASMMTDFIALTAENDAASLDHHLQSLLPLWAQLASHCGGDKNAELNRWAFNLLAQSQHPAVPLSDLRALLVNSLPVEAWSLVPALEKRQQPTMSTWTYQNEVMAWDIPPEALVLDVGSGGWPFKRADHLADRYPDETTHRVEAIARDQRPFFEADLEKLPFQDKSYDFVFCSHVLEHLDQPGQAMRELMRVGHRGYIEVPTRLSDIMFNFTRLPNHHRWHGLRLGDTLAMIEWNDSERRDLGNEFFDALQNEYHNSFQDFFERNRDLFFISYPWTGKIKFLVINNQGTVIDSSEEGV